MSSSPRSSFNLNREAAPLATLLMLRLLMLYDKFQFQPRSRSISDEREESGSSEPSPVFQSQPRSRSISDFVSTMQYEQGSQFQSQPRSRSISDARNCS